MVYTESVELWKEMHMGDMLDRIGQMFPAMHFSVHHMLELLLQGDLRGVLREACDTVLSMATVNCQSLRQVLISFLMLGILGAFYAHFSNLVEKYRLSEISFYFIYLVQATMLARCYAWFLEMVQTLLDNLILFVRLLMPIYLLSVSVATGTVTAGAGCQLLLFLIYGIEEGLQKMLLPMLSFFFLIALLEGTEGSERWDGILELIKKGTQASLGAALSGVAAIGFLQAVLTPAVDSLKGTAMQRLIMAIPGLGNSAESVIRLAAGSAVVLKNGIGVLLLVLLLVLCAAPLLQILALVFTLKLASAVMGIVCDKRLAKVVDRTGQTGMLMFRVAGTALLFFWLAIALTTVSVRVW